MTRIFRLILYPFTILYGLVTSLRNVLFDLGWLSIYKPKVKTIAIGNLNIGGTGKTPFTELLLRMLENKYSVAVVSRGYGRKTKGFKWVEKSSEVVEVGDETLQIKHKFPSVLVAVCEKRAVAIKKIESEHPNVDLIIMDDAFQHRYVQAHVYILLSTYKNPYYKDFVLPSGNLRESRYGAYRADMIVMTKCPPQTTPIEKAVVLKKIKSRAYQKVFFSKEEYGKMYHLFTRKPFDIQMETVLLISGIADNSYILDYIGNRFENVESFNLSDHVVYNKSLIERIKLKFVSLNNQFLTCIITTEKDAIKLKSFNKELSDLPVYVLPFEHRLFEASEFSLMIEDKIMT